MKTAYLALVRSTLFFGIILSMLSLSSCHETMEWDYSPIVADIYIKDAAGNNLLSPDTPGNLRGKKIVAMYDGEEYELIWSTKHESRYYLPTFKGLTLTYDYLNTSQGFQAEYNTAHLSFGEFDATKDQDISLSLKIEGYTETWDISIINRFKGKPKTNTYLNGKKVSFSNIVITL